MIILENITIKKLIMKLLQKCRKAYLKNLGNFCITIRKVYKD